MADHPNLNELLQKLQAAEMRQQQLAFDIKELRRQVQSFQPKEEPEVKTVEPIVAPVVIQEEKTQIQQITPKPSKPKQKTAWEDFIGTNLLNKIGIVVLVIGIGFGVKYAIDHQMLNPLTRIILGYLAGSALLGIALKLKKNYAAFSAVLLSGGMASLYFITYAAYDFYQLIPQLVAFVLMVLFTTFTVFAALQYKQQVIAIIGLVGAYAVPFLLSDGSGRVVVLLSYVLVINTGILFISFKQDWRGLFRFAFILTWLIVFSWLITDYYYEKHLWIILGFTLVYFIQFYLAFLVSKLSAQQNLKIGDISLILSNSFIYYGLGYGAISDHPNGEYFLGLFTAFNAIIHFAICLVLYYKLRQVRDVFYFVAGMVLTFLTLAVPVQLEGNWVTVTWALEAVLLFWIGRTKKFPVYELLSYPLIGLALLSLLHDWSALSFAYNDYYYYTDNDITFASFINVYFLTGILVSVMFGATHWLSSKTAYEKPHTWLDKIVPLMAFILPAGFILVLYTSILKEISLYFNQQYYLTSIKQEVNQYNYDWPSFKAIWLIIYSAAFILIMWFINQKFIRNILLNKVAAGASILLVITFLSGGLVALEALRNTYLNEDIYFVHSFWNIVIRYISYLFIGLILYLIYSVVQHENKTLLTRWERLFFHFSLLTILSSELLSWLALNNIHDGVRLALSILWGAYALYLIVWGFTKNFAFLRISGIVLFGITLAKLFLYDLTGMSTIAKTIVLMVLGALLLTASFIYNKRKKNNPTDEPNE
ncbi:MAG TPA: DUF2339 domain-containing protein [Cyclobacteriaceae bacterium]|jgi:uncharacterized membrane protein|nr:DUF2339 domain-containing protein [Cytophagales bacterium]HMR56112.1 DUF2339 domain-containing protein [Cyclobacteriaceae bacterium]HRE66099.1 DUF2339 domain-containing protein [Cyclobacteriaceae bacterium]HRF32210.1 DUF2339 domain-containing protein [Cyclobacteriaceae bacterium]